MTPVVAPSGPATRPPRWTTRPATSSPSSSHHGMLGVSARRSGAPSPAAPRSYVDAVAAGAADVRLSSPGARRSAEHADGVEVTDRRAGAGPAETLRRRRGRHPPRPGARDAGRRRPPASGRPWRGCRTRGNAPAATRRRRCCPAAATPRPPGTTGSPVLRRPRRTGVLVTYDLTRLQRLDPRTARRYLVTLGGPRLVDHGRVLDRMDYEHPLYTPESRGGAARSCPRSTRAGSPSPAPTTAGASTRTARCPASRRRGRAGTVDRGGPAPCPDAAGRPELQTLPLAGSRSSTTRRHLPHLHRPRAAHPAAQRLHLPQLQLAASTSTTCPRLPRCSRPLAGFEAARPPGRPGRHAARQRRTLPRHPGHRRSTAAGSSCWPAPRRSATCSTRSACSGATTPDGELRCVVVEVHNTYGDRHGYLVDTDDARPRHACRQGALRLAVQRRRRPVPDDAARTRANGSPSRSSWSGEGQQPFIATLDGVRREATVPNVLAAALAVPLAPLRVSAQIRWHGIWLWARRLPVIHRPHHSSQEAVQ